MNYRCAYFLCQVLFGALLLTFVYGYHYARTSCCELVVDEPERILPDLIVGREYTLDYHVHDCSGEMMRIVGSEFL